MDLGKEGKPFAKALIKACNETGTDPLLIAQTWSLVDTNGELFKLTKQYFKEMMK